MAKKKGYEEICNTLQLKYHKNIFMPINKQGNANYNNYGMVTFFYFMCIDVLPACMFV